MSYILDALKKNQAEQHQDGMTVGLTAAVQEQRGVNPWLIVIGVGLVLNAGVLAWYVLSGEPPTVARAEETPRTATPANVAPVQQPAVPVRAAPTRPATTTAPAQAQTEPPGMPVRTATPPRPKPAASAPTATQTRRPAQPTPAPTRRAEVEPPAPIERPAGIAEGETVIGPSSRSQTTAPVLVASAPRVPLASLPAPEQTRFQRLSYTSHIYTDDPTLCAVVIDGTRYQMGDEFEELRIVEITETGLVFEQVVAGARRHVVVAPFE